MKRLLIVGASSFVGSNLAVYFRDQYHVYGTHALNSPKIDGVTSFTFFIRPGAPVRELVRLLRPDVVIYCAAQIDDTKCKQDPDGTLYINAGAPLEFARILDETGGKFIYISSSKVFSGGEGNYSEDDIPSPQGAYGSSKVRGEENLATLSNTFVVRLGTIFGLGAHGQNSAIINRILKQLWSGERTGFISDEFRSFLWVREVARALGHLIDARLTGPKIFHFAPSQRDTYHTFANAVGSTFGLTTAHFFPMVGKQFAGKEASAGGARGGDLTLTAGEFKRAFSYDFEEPAQSLIKIHEQLKAGKQ